MNGKGSARRPKQTHLAQRQEGSTEYEAALRREFCPYCGSRQVVALAIRPRQGRRHITNSRKCQKCGKGYGLMTWTPNSDRLAGLIAGAAAQATRSLALRTHARSL